MYGEMVSTSPRRYYVPRLSWDSAFGSLGGTAGEGKVLRGKNDGGYGMVG